MEDTRDLRSRAESSLEVTQRSSDSPPSEIEPLAAADLRPLLRFYFSTDYDGVVYRDEEGELFSTAQQAEKYGAQVAYELGRNNSKKIIVYVSGEDGTVFACISPVR